LKDVLAKSFSSVDVVDAKINVDNILVHRLNQERGLRQMDNERTVISRNMNSLLSLNLEI